MHEEQCGGWGLVACPVGPVRSRGGSRGRLRSPAGSGAMSAVYLIGGALAVVLLGYLVYALVRAEDF